MEIRREEDVRVWFRDRLLEALGARRVEVSEETEAYLVELLATMARSSSAPEVSWVELLTAALEARGRKRLLAFRALGDSALYAAGFFAENLTRRGLQLDYAVAMGRRGYASAEDLAVGPDAVRRTAYGELAEGFRELVGVLDDVRETTDLKTPQDIVKLYDRWRRTRSPKLAARLRAEGVYPSVAPDGGLIH